MKNHFPTRPIQYSVIVLVACCLFTAGLFSLRGWAQQSIAYIEAVQNYSQSAQTQTELGKQEATKAAEKQKELATKLSDKRKEEALEAQKRFEADAQRFAELSADLKHIRAELAKNPCNRK